MVGLMGVGVDIVLVGKSRWSTRRSVLQSGKLKLPTLDSVQAYQPYGRSVERPLPSMVMVDGQWVRLNYGKFAARVRPFSSPRQGTGIWLESVLEAVGEIVGVIFRIC